MSTLESEYKEPVEFVGEEVGEVEEVDWRAAAATAKPDLEIHVLYTLSEEGRKASLMSGGNGHCMQLITYTTLSMEGNEKAMLRLARVHEDGQIIIYLTDWNPSVESIVSFVRGLGRSAGEINRLIENIKRNDGKRCPRRVVRFVSGGAGRIATATLVPLNHESQANRFEMKKYDYDLPFDDKSMLSYLLGLEAEQNQQLEVGLAEANRQNLESLDKYNQDQAAGRQKLMDWLKQPGEPAAIFDNLVFECWAAKPWGAMFGTDLHTYPLDEDSFTVLKDELDRRRQAAKDREDELAIKQHESKMKVIENKRKAMEQWVGDQGSKYLQSLFRMELFEAALQSYHEERTLSEAGSSWQPVRKDVINEELVTHPKLYELEDLVDGRATSPDARMRLAKLTWKHGPAVRPVPVSLVKECPWDDDFVLIRATRPS